MYTARRTRSGLGNVIGKTNLIDALPARLDFVPLEHHIAQKSIYEELIMFQPNARRFSGIDLQRKKTRNEGD
jgi:hypothetical protein